MDLATSGNHPFNVTIDGQQYVVERLNISDLAGISQTIKADLRQAVAAEYDEKLKAAEEDSKQLSELEREKINAVAAVESPGPSELMAWLLTDFTGMATALFVALTKKQPEVPFTLVQNLEFGDEVMQTVYDILGVKLKVVKKAEKKDGSAADPSLARGGKGKTGSC